MYDRLVEYRPAQTAPYVPRIAFHHAPWSGLNCSIFLADITAFGGNNRTDNDRQFLRTAMYAILECSFERSGIPWDNCYREDRGDGVQSLLVDPLPVGL